MITLEVSESEEQVIFGIPYYLDVSSSEGVIYYTFDGTTPTRSSLSSDGKIYLPSNDSYFDVKIIAISEFGSSDLYENTFVASTPMVKNTRKGNESGVVVMTKTSDSVNHMYFDSEGNETGQSSIDFNELDIKSVKLKHLNINEEGKTTVDFINFPLKDEVGDDFFKRSVVNSNVNFDPKSKVIIVNARTEEEIENQSVILINRSYDTFDPSSKFYVENEYNFRQIISGNLVRSVYNSSTGVLTSYYYESKESKWIVSNQKIEPKSLNLSNSRVKNFVYKWVEDPVMSKIF